MDKTHILDEIRRTARENGGRPLGKARFLAETGIRESDWSGRHWLTWNEAVREAGLEPNTMQQAFEADFLIEKLAETIRDLGHYPTVAELKMRSRNDPEIPTRNTFQRLGHKPQAAAAVMTWCEEQGDWDDVVALCAPVAEQAIIEDDAKSETEAMEFGFVYLVKSGKFYKIGRSNAPGRRAYELSIQLPERVSTVHTIKTDDPAGIEAYWHKRFAERRKNGEWFELSQKDVSAFRRRKLM